MARFKVQLSSGGLGGLFYMGELDPATANQNRAFQIGGLQESHSPGNGAGDSEMSSRDRKCLDLECTGNFKALIF